MRTANANAPTASLGRAAPNRSVKRQQYLRLKDSNESDSDPQMSNEHPKPSPQFDAQQAGKYFFRGGHTGWLGMRYHDHGDNWVELELPWRGDLLGEPDRPVLASGPIISLMDMASGMSIWQTRKTFVPIATLDLRVDYQRPARDRSAVWGRVECYRTTRSAAFVRGIAHDGNRNDPVASMAGVFMNIAMDPRSSRMVSGKEGPTEQVPEAGTGDE